MLYCCAVYLGLAIAHIVVHNHTRDKSFSTSDYKFDMLFR